jgi:hypothetical protein
MFVIKNFSPCLKSQIIDIYEKLDIQFNNRKQVSVNRFLRLIYDSDR